MYKSSKFIFRMVKKVGHLVIPTRVRMHLLDRNLLDYFIFKLFIILLEKHFKMFTYNLNTKTHCFLQNFFRMLYVVMSYKSMTSDYCFLTSNILKNNKHHLKITKFLHLKSQKDQYKLF